MTHIEQEGFAKGVLPVTPLQVQWECPSHVHLFTLTGLSPMENQYESK